MLRLQGTTKFLDVPFFNEKMWDSGAVLDGLTAASLALVVKDLIFSWSSWGIALAMGRTFKSWIPVFAERLIVGIISLSLASEIYARLNYSHPGTAPFLIGSAAIGSAIVIDQLSSWPDQSVSEADSLDKMGERVSEESVSYLSGLPAVAMILAATSYGILTRISPQVIPHLAALVDWIYWPLGHPTLAWVILIYSHLKLACQFLALPSAISRLIHWAKTGNVLYSHSP